MVTKKENYGELYIPMNDVSEKRKNLLLSIKNSLIMQEEYEKILELRSHKSNVLKAIKKEMSLINGDYLKVKKFFPNIKNVLSNTEKEITELESQIALLKTSSQKNKDDVEKLEQLEKTLQTDSKRPSQAKETKITKAKKTPTKPKKVSEPKLKYKPTSHNSKKPLSKKERVRNNLEVLESKLKNL